MNQGFVPLSLSAAASQNKLPAEPTASTPFRPLFTPAPPAPAASSEPKLTLKREAGRITTIKIQCSCGQVIELACDY
jgi:hypothetical protein